jgi:putative ABC transport system permease protein
VSNFRVQAGRPFTRADERGRQRVVVLGDAVARRLFGWAARSGARLTANGARYQVIGVLRRRGAGTGLVAQDNSAGAPLTAVHREPQLPRRPGHVARDRRPGRAHDPPHAA